MLLFTLILCFVTALAITPLIKMLAYKIGATDNPDHRKVHQVVMPRLGGLAIFMSFILGVLIINPSEHFHLPIIDLSTTSIHLPIVIGSFIIIFTGICDDIIQISPKWKLLGQLVAAIIVVVVGDIRLEFINLPFGGQLSFGEYLSIPITLIWIIGITNAINLIDGLDGLAAGVSAIALFSIAGMAVMMGNPYVMVMALIVGVSALGFLVFNFYPAKIFMGDTGALFLGYMISVLSLLGFKNVTFVSLIVPILILAVPILDTAFAIIRRLINKQPLSSPDKSHMHHCLIRIGYTHKQTVLVIYLMSAMFGIAAFIFSQTTIWGSFIVLLFILVAVELLVEKIGLIKEDYKPLLNFINARKPMKSKYKNL
ncbi:UDP-GlcNAc:undecaprenyl-phosphate GlcNAc-1-phosphate transferase [Salirhabdus euzebyi]|uniref:UDP-GlcNAc:undecaprenyl-phosphate GlcNAc-1-phosphate transferase n=1 Tax=Salirhabdus euzebyi TaxID=394506 RepID=A0A841Q811_9BACI|nr:MraY family glycosyltransferase [Salirhabdus euzebyi]MBB6454515.1 UDP-GlcNAc:undecaprenyl-phosphate GlcNAc-1-phosphate transferase [Salirhabdus euzebyi]